MDVAMLILFLFVALYMLRKTWIITKSFNWKQLRKISFYENSWIWIVFKSLPMFSFENWKSMEINHISDEQNNLFKSVWSPNFYNDIEFDKVKVFVSCARLEPGTSRLQDRHLNHYTTNLTKRRGSWVIVTSQEYSFCHRWMLR